MSNSAFNHTVFNTFEYGITNAFINEFWAFLTDAINNSDLFDETDKMALFSNSSFLTQFLDENEAYIHQKVIKPKK